MRAYGALLADRRFRRFWLGLLLVMLADEFVRTTLTWEVYRATQSSEAVGLLMVCFTGPIILGGLIAGWLLDRFPRARVMAADAALRTTAMIVTAGTIAAAPGGVAPLFILATVQGSLTMVLLAGAPSAIAELIAPEHRSAANALEMLGFTAAATAGPFLAGLLAGRIGVSLALLLAALCYAVFALSVRTMPIGGGQRPAHADRVPWRDSGVLHPTVAIITVMFVIVNIGGGVIAVILPVMVDRGLGLGGEAYGSLVAVGGIGSSIAAIAAGMFTGTGRLPAAVAIMQILSGITLLPLAALIAWGKPTLAAVAALYFLYGLACGPLTVWAQTIRMRFVVPEWRGRAFATLRMIMQSGRPIGGALGGFAIAVVPLTMCIVAASAIISLPAALALCQPAMNRRLTDVRNRPV